MNKQIIYIAESLCESVKDSLLKAIDELNETKGMQIRCEMLKNVPGCKEYYWCRDNMPVLISDDGKYATFRFDPDYLREYKTYVTSLGGKARCLLLSAVYKCLSRFPARVSGW